MTCSVRELNGMQLKRARVCLGRSCASAGPMHFVHTQQLFEALRRSGWSVAPAIKARVREQVSGITKTQIVEDAVRQGRVEEVSTGFKKTVSGPRLGLASVKRELAQIKHRFASMDWQSEVFGRSLKHRSTSGLFTTMTKWLPKHWKKIVASSSNAPCQTIAASMACKTVEDREFASWCVQYDEELKGASDWMSVSAVSKIRPLQLRHPRVNSGPGMISLGSGSGVCTSALESEEFQHMGAMYYVMKAVTWFHFLSILGWASWECTPFEFRSPLSVRCQSGGWPRYRHTLFTAPMHGGRWNLLQMATKLAFWDMPLSALRRVAKEEGASFEKGDDIAEMLLAIALQVLSDWSDADKLQMLRRSVKHEDEARQHCEDDSIKECPGKDELADIDELQEKEAEHAGVTKTLARYAKKLQGTSGGSSTGASASRARRSTASSEKVSPAPNKTSRKYPPKITEKKCLSQDDIHRLFPDNCQIFPDVLQQRWQLRCRGQRFSKAWRFHGMNEAACDLIQSAWRRSIA